jgi:hypothetical protein
MATPPMAPADGSAAAAQHPAKRQALATTTAAATEAPTAGGVAAAVSGTPGIKQPARVRFISTTADISGIPSSSAKGAPPVMTTAAAAALADQWPRAEEYPRRQQQQQQQVDDGGGSPENVAGRACCDCEPVTKSGKVFVASSPPIRCWESKSKSKFRLETGITKISSLSTSFIK